MPRPMTVDDVRAMLEEWPGHTPVLLELADAEGYTERGAITHHGSTTTSTGRYCVLAGRAEGDDL